VDRFAVREKHHSEMAVLRLSYLCPPTDAAISLHFLFSWSANGPFDPLVPDGRSIRARP